MKNPTFSILIPTRAGADTLGDCIDSVLADPGDDIEVVVSDNANTDGTQALLAARAADPRLRVVRQAVLLGVTDNWNAALAASRGDYILMLGDDDLVRPELIARMRPRVSGAPDCVSFGAWMYLSPGALPGHPSAMYGAPWKPVDRFLRNGVYSLEARRLILEELFAFRQPIPLTMASTLVSRKAAERLPRGIFRAPFPDWYAHAALLIEGGRWEYTGERLAVIGVSGGSFSTYFNDGDFAAGLAYLGLDQAGGDPGSEMLDSVVDWLTQVRDDFPGENLRIDQSEYAVRRVWNWVKRERSGRMTKRELVTSLLRLPFDQQVSLIRGLSRLDTLRRGIAVRGSATDFAAHPWWREFKDVDAASVGDFGRMLNEHVAPSQIQS